MNIHPGVVPILKRMSADELTVAEMIRDGELTSPQKFHNMLLLSVRITGTGMSYRPPPINEYVIRQEEDYLTDRFLQRCNGLPLIWKHPSKSLLNSDEFSKRVIGTVFLPFIKELEVWAICKVFDEDAIGMVYKEQLSTSPAVLLNTGSIIKRGPNGEKILIEEGPAMVDHIALLDGPGVWDKGGELSGVDQENLGRADAIIVPPLVPDRSKLLDCMKNFSTRIDAFVGRMERHCV